MFSPSNFNFIYSSVSFGSMLIYGMEYVLNLFCSYDYWTTPELPLICFLCDAFFIICCSKLPNVLESSFGLSDTFSGFAYSSLLPAPYCFNYKDFVVCFNITWSWSFLGLFFLVFSLLFLRLFFNWLVSLRCLNTKCVNLLLIFYWDGG